MTIQSGASDRRSTRRTTQHSQTHQAQSAEVLNPSAQQSVATAQADDNGTVAERTFQEEISIVTALCRRGPWRWYRLCVVQGCFAGPPRYMLYKRGNLVQPIRYQQLHSTGSDPPVFSAFSSLSDFLLVWTRSTTNNCSTHN